MKMKVRREVLRSVHGPVVRQPHGVYAIRYAGMGDVRQVEQWYRMNRAENKDEWLEAMKMRAIPSLNCGYADNDGNIGYLYNALIPVREPGYDWEQYLPGDTSETLWSEVVPFEELPQVFNPPSGFIQNCNSSPFQTTAGAGNPDAAEYPAWMGIESHMTNRALRALQLLGADDSITWDEFIAYKFDMNYSGEALVARLVARMLEAPAPEDELTREALAVLKEWDYGTDPENRGTALGVMTALPHHNNNGQVPDAAKLFESLRAAAESLKKVHGRVDVPWREVNRLQRGTLDLGIGGGPDILHAVS
ncbi:MAG: penicillin acylase family protein, partial [Candidatus Hydrogenedentales bacterium]